MQRAPGAEESQKRLLDAVATALRQRLGKDRMDLWFGSGTTWEVADREMIRIAVPSEFMANCINTMFRGEIQEVVRHSAGPDWGWVVAPKRRGNCDNSVESSPEAGAIAYDRSPSATTDLVSAGVPSVPPSDSATLNAIPSYCSSNVSGDAEPAAQEPAAGGGLGLRVVRPESSMGDAQGESQSERPGRGRIEEESPDAEVERLLALRKQGQRRWEDFVRGEHNRLAFTGAEMILERPGQISPFLIFGPHGVGKTHLANAIVQRLRQQYRMRRVLSLTGEQFTIEYTESARGGGFANFRRKYRDVEALVIDDVHFCLGKSGTLAELRNTIDMLLRERRQVILVADRGLPDLLGLGTDLYARLSGGMCCGIQPMDCVTREQLLGRICKSQGLQIDASVLHELAVQCGGDARILQGLVHRMVAQQRLQGSPLREEDVFRCTSDLLRASQPIVRLNDIERVVCEVFGLQDEMLRAKTKCQSVSQPRMLAMFLARKYTRTALSEIGEYFGKRQHSTVISAQRKVEEWLSQNDSIALGRSKVEVREILKNLENILHVG